MNDLRTNLAQSIHNWIINEMKYSPDETQSKIPSVYEIKNLCRGSSIHVWRFLIERIKSESHVKTIRQNIEILNNKKASDKELSQKIKRKEFLLNRKELLQQQLMKTQSDIDKVQLDISYIKKDICDYNKEIDQLTNRIKEINNKITLTKAYSNKTEVLLAILKEYQSRLKRNINDINTRSNDSSSDRRMTLYDSNNEMESSHEKLKTSLNQSIDGIKAWFTKSLMNNNDHTIDSTVRNDIFNDSSFIKSVPFMNKDILKKGSPKQIINELISLVRYDSNQLHSGTAHLSALKDLKNKVNEEFALFLSSYQPLNRSFSSFTTVQNILNQQKEDHFNQFVSTEHVANECYAVKQICEQMMKSMNVVEVSANQTPPNSKIYKQSLISRMRKLEVLIASEKAALAHTNQIIQRLNENLNQYENASLLLKDKFELIQECEQYNKELLNTVHYIAKTMRQYKKIIEQKVCSLTDIISHRVLPLKYEDTKGVVQEYIQYMNRDIQVTFDFPLRYYYYHYISNKNRYSIHSLKLKDDIGIYCNIIQFILSTLDVPQYKSYDQIVDYITKYIRRVEYKNDLIEIKKKTVSNSKAKLNQLNNEDILSLYQEKWNDFKKLQEDHWIPSLNDCISKCKSALEKCKHVKTLSEEWWNQPAQHLVTWITNKEGKNFSECLKEWRDLSHQLNKNEYPLINRN